MRSQSGTFYKIIVTCLLLGVSHISLSTGSPAEDAKEATLTIVPAETPKSSPVPANSGSSESLPSALALKTAVSSNSNKDGTSSPATEGKNKPIVLKTANEVLLTAAQSYFIEPPTSTTTTKRPTFKRRKTSKPISSLTEKKKPPVVDNDIPQGNPVPFNPFRQLMNTNFGKSRPSETKLGRTRNRINLSRVNNQQTGSPINDKINEIPSSTTESEARPFNRRRPIQEENNRSQRLSINTQGNSDAPEAPQPRRFPLRRPRPTSDESRNTDNNDNNRSASTQTPPPQRTFRRIRPTTTASSSSGAGVIAGSQNDEGGQIGRVRPIRPLGRLTNRNPTTTSTTTSTTTTIAPTTTTDSLVSPIIPVINEQSPFQPILPFPESPLFSIDNLVNNTDQEIPSKPEVPEHISDIVNGIAPISILPSKPELEQPRLRPLLRTSGETERKPGFVLRPATSGSTAVRDNDDDGAPRPIRRRKRPLSTTTEGPAGTDNQSFTGGIVLSRLQSSNERIPGAVRGGIPNSAIPRNPRRGTGTRNSAEINGASTPASPRDRTNMRGFIRTSVNNQQGGVINLDNSGNERLPNSPRGRVPSVGIPRNPVNVSPVPRDIITNDDNTESNGIPNSPRDQIQNFAGSIPRNPPAPSQDGILIQNIINGIPSSPTNRNPFNIQRNPTNSFQSQGGVQTIPNLLGNHENPILGDRIPNLGYSGNPITPPAFRGGVVGPAHDTNHPDYDNSPYKNNPSLARAKPIEIPTPIPFPSFPSFKPFPSSYQIHDEGSFLEPLIPNLNTFDDVKMPEQPVVKAPSPTVLREAGPPPLPPYIVPTNRPAPITPTQILNTNLGRPSGPQSVFNTNLGRPSRPGPIQTPNLGRPPIPNTIINNNNIAKPSAPVPLFTHIKQVLSAAMNPANKHFSKPGLFQVPPRDNLKFYPGLDNVLGVSTNFKTVQRKPGRNQFSSRTTHVPEDEIKAERSPSASNENQSVVFAEISDSPPSDNSNGDLTSETNQPDSTTIITTSTTEATPTKRLSPLQKLQQNRQAAARRFLTPRKPTEKTTSAPINKKPVNNLRKSVIPPRTLRTRGKLSQENSGMESSSKQENSGENLSQINNASVQSSQPDASINVIPTNPDQEAEGETSSRKPTLLEKAKRRRIPIPNKSSPSPIQPQQQRVPTRNTQTSSPDSEAPVMPNCEEGHRYSKFLKRCIVMYKPKVQG